MSDFKWAVKQAEKGIDTERERWDSGAIKLVNDGELKLVYTGSNEPAALETDDVLADDWVLCEKPDKTLSDNLISIGMLADGFLEKDVKKFIEVLKNIINIDISNDEPHKILGHIDRLAGKRLV